jgi:hypothetical protein
MLALKDRQSLRDFDTLVQKNLECQPEAEGKERRNDRKLYLIALGPLVLCICTPWNKHSHVQISWEGR